jgi:uncharacterized protein YprB with RNaseH-like and TPR domain
MEVPGEIVHLDCGTFIRHEHRIALAERHGSTTLAAARALPPRDAAMVGREPRYADVSPERRAYIDTETTSLASGAGVFVFLVGAGRFEGASFVVRQYFMRHPGEERAMLEDLAGWLADVEALVSFHGKAFDCPRTRDRYLFQGLDAGLFEGRAHLDLLYGARRLFRHRLPDCRLQTLERHILGFERSDDLPGALCPEAWFRYQRGEENLIPRVMDHNRDDILSLVTLEARMARSLDHPEDPVESAAAGLLADSAGDHQRARPLLLECARTPAPGLDAAVALRVGRALRRLGELEAARSLLTRLITAHPADPRPVSELAILEEWSARNPTAALTVTEAALARLTAADPSRPSLERRRLRLRRKAPESGHTVPRSDCPHSSGS